MDRNAIIHQLELNIDVFRAVMKDCSPEEYEWRSAPGKWNLTEIISHLRDEECEDFRARLKHTLEQPEKELPSIDPAYWVSSRKYSANDPLKTLGSFLEERKSSVAWLKSLDGAGWNNYHVHPKFGKMSAEMFLSEWLSHDMLHLRQVLSLRYHYHRNKCGEQLKYAGDW